MEATMTNSSLIKSVAPVIQKGSTYGKASRTSPSSYSFQQSQRGCGSVYSNRIQVLSKEATLFPLQSQSIVSRWYSGT